MQAGHVRVVQGHVGVRGAADADLAAVQQMHAAGVGSRDHVELGRDVVQVGTGLGGCAQTEHGAVGQRWLAECAALGVEPLRGGVQHGRA